MSGRIFYCHKPVMSLSRRDAILLLSALIFFLASAIVAAMILLVRHNREQILETLSGKQTISETPTEIKYVYFSRLTGQGVLTEAEVKSRVIAVMVNNNPEGYPTAGLNEAAVVYEAPVEGSVTRFLAIYPETANPERVGPVRSARPYYLDWLEEYGTALYMHCGGSQEGLAEIKERNIFDADEFFRTPYFWRDHSLVAPHNLFTSGDKWRQYLDDYSKRHEFSDWQGWNFGDLNATGTKNNLAVAYAYGKKFIIGWRYDNEKKIYLRTLNGEDFLDNKNQPITSDNIVFQFATVKILDEIGRRNIGTTGEGEARLLRDGLTVRGTWKKEKTADRTRFYDMAGREINLKPGRTWIMIVPKTATLNITN